MSAAEDFSRSYDSPRMAAAAEPKDILRFLTCGSVDDGKSTLIGRLLLDTEFLLDDQLQTLKADSARHGTAGDELDPALLVDGLASEREQGITIDVAYRFFATPRRKFIVADTPGHEQYTRNMATGASNADLAVLLVDARHGVMTQTRRHAFIASLLGIRHVVLAVNKMDLVGFAERTFERIAAEFGVFAGSLRFGSITAIPISARHGDNVIARSGKTPWYDGPTLIEHLEGVDVPAAAEGPFRMPVQWVNRPNLDFRGFAGTVARGRIRPGDSVAVADSGRPTRVRSIVTYDGTVAEAVAGDAVTLTFEEEVDASRGDVLAAPDSRPEVADQFAANLIWMHDDALIPGRAYLLKLGTRTVAATVRAIRHRIDVNSMAEQPAETLGLNEVGLVEVSTQAPVAFDPYGESRTTGAFIVIDRMSNLTVGAGMIAFSLRRASNIHRQALDVTKASRAAIKGQKPAVLWFTGLSGAGKSTIANLVERRLHTLGRHTALLDGDNVRHGLNRDLGFTEADRIENIRRVAETAKLFVEAGLIVLVSFISPFRAERRMARELVDAGEFVEIFVDTPLAVAEGRDTKGLYRRARAGELKNFTGIDSPYEAPEAAEVRLSAGAGVPEDLADQVVAYLVGQGYVSWDSQSQPGEGI